MRTPVRLFNAAGAEVFITYRCYQCRQTLPIDDFGLRKMADGKLRSIPWCRECRSGYRKDLPNRTPSPGQRVVGVEGSFAVAGGDDASAPPDTTAVASGGLESPKGGPPALGVPASGSTA